MTPNQIEYVSNAPESVRKTLQRAFECQSSPRNAIKAKCLTCSNYQREEIRDCHVQLCPLYPWRPFQDKAKSEEVSELADE